MRANAISAHFYAIILVVLIQTLLYPHGESRAGQHEHPYNFFARLTVTESVTGKCNYPCATPVVEKVDLYLHGGFTIRSDQVTGSGEIEVIPRSDCTVVAQNGGGVGSSCRIAGPKIGGFTVTGRQTDVVRISGDTFAPKVTITLHPTRWPDLIVNFFLSFGGGPAQPVPVNHYQNSYQALVEQAGLLNEPFSIVAIQAKNFVAEAVMQQISHQFQSRLELPAPGFIRVFTASGDLAFTRSPHTL